MNAHASYAARLLVVASIAAVVSKFAVFNSVVCDTFDGADSSYMAYCNRKAYTHYDHAAFLFDLEPGVRKHVQAANLLVLGSSHIQVALSTEAFVAFEREHPHARPYLMGFGFFEQDRFSASVIRKLRPTPRLVIINADPFFADTESAEARRLDLNPGIERMNAVVKRAGQTLSRVLCIDLADSFVARHVCGGVATMYRSRTDGRWIFRNSERFADTLHRPLANADDRTLAVTYAVNAERFLRLFPIERRCIVLTLVPDGIHSELIARDIASRVGATFIAPPLERLRSPDGSHLDRESAERWSAAFLERLAPLLPICSASGPD